MAITWIKTNYSLANYKGAGDTFHARTEHEGPFRQMWSELAGTKDCCAIYISRTVIQYGKRIKNTKAESWQLGTISGFVKARGNVRRLSERDASGVPRWEIAGDIEELIILDRAEVLPLKPMIQSVLGLGSWPNRVQHVLRGGPVKLQGMLLMLRTELENAFSAALRRRGT